ncbi:MULTISPECIES: MoxR family ATPase [unclassified Pseudomonas]|uniref:AAA family ATPase n=1 Tax=unclassified Pseudomonas TaxID=196821 RepID=UPI00298D1273|nr:MoxR family ATPase [Pseudomonas sp. PDM18]
MSVRNRILELERSLALAVLGQGRAIRQILLGLLANGHLLLEGLPGLAKTRTVKALARHLDARMSRIQFTPDLLPSDITGAEVLHQAEGRQDIRFQPGPLFGNLILADEINRAPAKVQSALLEAMEERQITVAGHSHRMPPLFMVLATQNPVEQEGTYPLPEAQLDRFLMKVLLDYPEPRDEAQMLRLLREEEQALEGAAASRQDEPAPLDPEVLLQARREVSGVYVAPAIDDYLLDLVSATRHPDAYDPQLRRWLAVGASPRGTLGLDRAARAHAWLHGQAFVTPDNVRAMLHPVLRHRLSLSFDALADGVDADQVLDRLLDLVPIPA